MLSHGPSAVVYAVCDTVVDGYLEVAGRAPDRRRRGRGVGLLARSAPTTRRGSTRSSARSPRYAARCCRCGSRCGGSPRERSPGMTGRRRPVLPRRRRPPRRRPRSRSRPSTRCCRRAFEAHLARIQVQQNDDMRKISAGAALLLRADPDRRHLRHELRPHARAALAARLPVGAVPDGRQLGRRCVRGSRSPAGCSRRHRLRR